MDIVDRLNLFLEETRISKSQFADSCNIPRPTVSQILSGRNKKISDEIIAKIHSIYPQLSIMWLMFGEGNMLATAVDGSNLSFTEIKSGGNIEHNLFENHLMSNDSDYADSLNRHTSFSSQKQHSSPISKSISKIVVFYSDNSFEEFHRV